MTDGETDEKGHARLNEATSAPPSGSTKCLRFGHWLTLCTINIYLLTYLLTYLLRDSRIIILILYVQCNTKITRND